MRKTVDEQFETSLRAWLTFEEGRYANEDELAALKAAGYNPASFDQYKAAKDPAFFMLLKAKKTLQHQTLRQVCQRVLGEAGRWLARSGCTSARLWPVVHSAYFIAPQRRPQHCGGLGLLLHAETPGLGGEVDNPKWKALWPGKSCTKTAIKWFHCYKRPCRSQ